MFLIRKLLDVGLAPLSLAILALIVGTALARRPAERLRRYGGRIRIAGIVGLVLLAYGVPFDFVARALEDRHPAVTDTTGLSRVKVIHVLGGGTRFRPGLPVSSLSGVGSTYRIVEGVRLQRLLPGRQLSFSGYAAGSALSTAEAGASLARALGVSAENIRVDEAPRTTSEEARALSALLGTEPFLLVTSALHMPRAILTFRSHGLNPIPAPTDFRARIQRHSLAEWLAPSPDRIELANETVHELLGLVVTSIASRR